MFNMLHPERGEPCLLKTLHDCGYEVWWGGKNDLLPGDMDPVEAGVCDVRYRPSGDDRTRLPHFHPNLHTTTDWRPDVGEPGYYSMFAGRLGGEKETEFLDPDWCTLHAAMEFVQNRQKDRPFCLFIALEYPHPPYGVEEPFFSAINRAELPLRIEAADEALRPRAYPALRAAQNLESWTEPQWDELRSTYYGMCMRVDKQLAMLTDCLKSHRQYDNTALFFFSDHGDFTGDYGLVEKAQNLFPDCLVRVPFVFKPPKKYAIDSGISDALIELIDLPATVFEMAGIMPDYDHFGKSLLPLLTKHHADAHREAVFCEGGRRRSELHCMEGGGADCASLYWPRSQLQQSNAPFHHGKAIMCRTHAFKLVHRYDDHHEFYDLIRDPGERNNRFSDPCYRTERAHLESLLLRWFIETSDVVPLCADQR